MKNSKRNIIGLLTFIFVFLIGMKGVYAADGYEIDTSAFSNTSTGTVAPIKLKIIGSPDPIKGFEFDAAKQNVTFTSMTEASGWSCTRTEGTNSDHFVCNYNGTISTAGTYDVVTLTYTKVVQSDPCGINVSGKEEWFKKQTPSCEKVGNVCYGLTGQVIDCATFETECGTPTTTTNSYTCQCTGGKCYGKNGNEVTEEQMKKECDTNQCRQENGKCYDKDGVEISCDKYKSICGDPGSPKTGGLGVAAFLIASILAVSALYFVKRFNKIY